MDHLDPTPRFVNRLSYFLPFYEYFHCTYRKLAAVRFWNISFLWSIGMFINDSELINIFHILCWCFNSLQKSFQVFMRNDAWQLWHCFQVIHNFSKIVKCTTRVFWSVINSQIMLLKVYKKVKLNNIGLYNI